jgi:hypothetical protein
LNITRSGTNLLVSWLTYYAGFQLETTTNLLVSGSWFPVATVNNAWMTSHTNNVSFFRLVQ